MNKITSRENQQLKFARRVRDGRESSNIFIEGLRLVDEALAAGVGFTHCFFSDPFLKSVRADDLISKLQTRNAELNVMNEGLFRSIADTDSPQGIIAIAGRPESKKGIASLTLAVETERLPLAVVLDRVNNPSNLGAVIRTVEAAGAAGVATTTGSADIFAAKTLRSAMGSTFRLPTFENISIDQIFDISAANGWYVTALDVGGSQDLYETDWTRPRLLVMGSEAHGLSGEVLERAKEVVRIPMSPTVESLNLAVSCGIALFEARRQNRLSLI